MIGKKFLFFMGFVGKKRNLLSIKENQLLFNRNPFCSAEICDKFGKTIKFSKKRDKNAGVDLRIKMVSFLKLFFYSNHVVDGSGFMCLPSLPVTIYFRVRT